MLEQFFSNRYANRADLFQGLSIWEEEAYRQLQGTYPVIFLSFADVKGDSFHTIRMAIIHKLVRLYSRFSFLKESPLFTDKDRAYFDSVNTAMEDDVAAAALNTLSDCLSRYYGKK